jgi:ABC-2 type transport system ATP-binding protein
MLELKNLSKRFGNTTALDSMDLKIETGEFFGLLGENGAGKTTTISMISTLLLPTEGEILIDGEKLTRRNIELKKKLSVITQEYSLRQELNMDEIMELQGRLYHIPKKLIRERTDELFEFCALTEHRKKIVRQCSGGMKRKLMVCRALLTKPEILLLDEPTVGMDALTRRQLWGLLRKLNGQKLTILLTTHYIEEAQALCGRVALIHKGRLVEVNTPEGFIAGQGRYAVDEKSDGEVSSRYFTERDAAVKYLSSLLPESKSATLRETSLEDVFVERIGKKPEDM